MAPSMRHRNETVPPIAIARTARDTMAAPNANPVAIKRATGTSVEKPM